MLVPLCVVWLVVVVLLGVATGLLTTSSSVLEKQLQKSFQQLAARDDEGDDNDVIIVNEGWRCKDESVRLILDEKSSLDTRNSTKDCTAVRQYTTPQRIALGTLVLVLFSSQMKFFQWIISTGSLSSMDTSCNTDGCLSPVTTWLTMFGLISGVAMITIGLRLIPADVDAEIESDIDRV
ncbi:hypothetical protein BGX26_000340 [Mortierella sp. AD094]|nr:hypothetical protein BGX26_000340 [Mortierella sp. AD094]